MTKEVIHIENLWFSRNHHPVLQDVRLDVEEKDFMAIIGPNGGGKTTLLRLILGLLKPDSGMIRVFGRSPKKASGKIGYVAQDPGINRHFPIRVLDVVMMGTIRSGWGFWKPSAAAREKAMEALRTVDMDSFHSRLIGELSGGQIQRVFIARALATRPEILLLDEPTASVDEKGQKDFYEILRVLNQKITILMVSHDFMMISSYVKSVACVNKTLYYHNKSEITGPMMDMYQCPVEIVAHGLPHRVLKDH